MALVVLLCGTASTDAVAAAGRADIVKWCSNGPGKPAVVVHRGDGSTVLTLEGEQPRSLALDDWLAAEDDKGLALIANNRIFRPCEPAKWCEKGQVITEDPTLASYTLDGKTIEGVTMEHTKLSDGTDRKFVVYKGRIFLACADTAETTTPHRYCSGKGTRRAELTYADGGTMLIRTGSKAERFKFNGSVGTGLNGSVFLDSKGQSLVLNHTTIDMDWNTGYEDTREILIFRDRVFWPCDKSE